MPKPAWPLFSTATGLGNADVIWPGNLESTLEIVAGIEFALGLSRLEEGRAFMALFDETGEISLRAAGSSFSFLGLGFPLASVPVDTEGGETGLCILRSTKHGPEDSGMSDEPWYLSESTLSVSESWEAGIL
jgi:hypothetical protein